MISKYQSRVPRGTRAKCVTVSKLRCPHCGELIEFGEGVVRVVELGEDHHVAEWIHETEASDA